VNLLQIIVVALAIAYAAKLFGAFLDRKQREGERTLLDWVFGEEGFPILVAIVVIIACKHFLDLTT
jgi:hypothetical protein